MSISSYVLIDFENSMEVIAESDFPKGLTLLYTFEHFPDSIFQSF